MRLPFFDEAQAYELDTVAAALSTGDVKTAVFLGDPNQSIEQRVQWPTWTRQPWISTESRSGRDEQAGSQQPQVASEEDLAEPADMDTLAPSGTATEAAEGSQTRLAVTPNPLQRQFTEWLLKPKRPMPGYQVLQLSGCKRCGPQVCSFISQLFPDFCQSITAADTAPQTRLVHTFYAEAPWRNSTDTEVAAPGAHHTTGLACCNDVVFSHLALAIWRNIQEAKAAPVGLLSHLQPCSGPQSVRNRPLVIVIVYLQRVAAPLRVFLRDVFGTLHSQGKLDPFKPEDIKVLVLDSVRGVTADYVHVIRGERSIGAQDQYLGIQSDLRREYISYTRGRLLCHVWLDDKPFGTPAGPPPELFKAKDRRSRGQDHAIKRNRLIFQQGLPWNLIDGPSWQGSMPWRSVWRDEPQELWDAIGQALHHDPLSQADFQGKLKPPAFPTVAHAISGMIDATSPMLPLLEESLEQLREYGIARARAPIEIIDADLVDRPRYPMSWAIRFAMLMAPALTADVHEGTELVQMCIPVVVGSGLDALGETVVEQGELMLRAFILIVLGILDITQPNHGLQPLALAHKAESVEIMGSRWYSKACNSDREACVLLDPMRARPKQKRIYTYLGGGGLSVASSWMTQGVVVRAKSWDEAAAVSSACTLLSAATPGPTVVLTPEFVTSDPDTRAGTDIFLDDANEVEAEAAQGDAPHSDRQQQIGPGEDFAALCTAQVEILATQAGIPAEHLSSSRNNTVEEARGNLFKLARFFEHRWSTTS